MGCGDTSGDPTAQITKLEAAPADVSPGGSAVITVTVVKAVGKNAEATVTETRLGGRTSPSLSDGKRRSS